MTIANKAHPRKASTAASREPSGCRLDTNAKIIADQYGTLYERDLSSDMYKVENAKTYFLTQDGYVYIVYAYGNSDYTNEMDIIIF